MKYNKYSQYKHYNHYSYGKINIKNKELKPGNYLSI